MLETSPDLKSIRKLAQQLHNYVRSNVQTEKQEFKQLIDRTHAAWKIHNPDALSKFGVGKSRYDF